MNPLLIAALGALFVCWVIFTHRQGRVAQEAKEAPPKRRVSEESTPFHAVAIRPGRRVCEKVKVLTGQRILSRDAPMLPVPGCDIVDCGCSYVHYKDRRSGKDRRSPFSSGGLSASTGNFQVERRASHTGRRRSEQDLAL